MSSTWPPRMVAPRAGSEQVDRPRPLSIHARSTEPVPPPPPPSPRSAPAVAPITAAPRPTAAPVDTSPALQQQPLINNQAAAVATSPQEPPMTRKPKRAAKPARRTLAGRKTPGGKVSAQFQVCALLMASGDLTREEIAAAVDVDKPNVLTNALFNGKTAKRIMFSKSSGKWSVTPAGRAWATGGANLDNQQASAPSPRQVKRSRREAAVDATTLPAITQRQIGVVPAPAVPVAKPAVRCAVISDGGFFLEKNGTRIDLEPDEHRAMLHYLDRMTASAAA